MKPLFWLTTVLVASGSFVQAATNSNVQSKNSIITAPASKTSPVTLCTDLATVLFRFNTLTIKPTSKGIQLSWVVEETANLQYFLIEQAADGHNFSPLFEVPAQPNQQSYSFVDTALKETTKTAYYRVKAVYPTAIIESPIRKLASQLAKL